MAGDPCRRTWRTRQGHPSHTAWATPRAAATALKASTIRVYMDVNTAAGVKYQLAVYMVGSAGDLSTQDGLAKDGPRNAEPDREGSKDCGVRRRAVARAGV